MREIEIWADSFHEGVWCCDNICAYLEGFSKVEFAVYCRNSETENYTAFKNTISMD